MRNFIYLAVVGMILQMRSDGASCFIRPLFNRLVLSFERWKGLIDGLPSGVQMLAVSKGHSASSIRCFAEFGQVDFGESRLQEALPKLEALKDLTSLRWHFIGRLQKNKVRPVVKSFDVIHSVDSFALAERISRIAGEEQKCPKIMLQVKFREDINKGGFDPEQLFDFRPKLFALPHLELLGLMTMAPKHMGLKERENLFRECRDLANQIGLQECSMGMSQDWQEALNSGSTWLRLGSALFGVRTDNVNLLQDITK